MASIRVGGNGDDAPLFDSLAKLYISVAIIWTTALFVGSAFLIANRHEQCIRIRNLPLALSAVSCLHVYWILCMVAYSMGGKYPCAAEYWIMSIYLPLGIALFQANSMQLLSVFGIQEKMLFNAQQPYRPHFIDREKSPRRNLFRWRQLNLVQRTELCIVVGLVIQLFLSLSIFLTSRKFQSFGTFSEHDSFDSLAIVLVLDIYTMYFVEDSQYSRHTQLAAPDHLLRHRRFTRFAHVVRRAVFVNRSLDSYQQILGAGSLAVTIFFPCYELVVSRRQRNRILRELQAWNEKKAVSADDLDSGASRNQSEVSRVPEVYSREALERCLLEDSSALLRFAAAKEFSGENIIFLNYVRDWKAYWRKINESKSEYDWKRDPQYYRLHFFKIAVEIYAVCVNLETAEFPINIESQIYSDLTEMFGEAAQFIGQSTSREAVTCSHRNVPGSYNLVPMHRKKLSTVITVEEDTHALCLDAYRHESQSIINIEPRVPNSVIVPPNFTVSAFHQAERSVKSLVLTNTWPKFINSSSDFLIHSK
ncbi:hypothetical protein N7510_008170 [Penicillium lagena]|uniref:uncharacterized protein n=1 Tax=Penicillium lagena TaxID=94218 RepID=UPI002541C9D8|nr:uncharacterized protein N7510_008170 [Penicillium lagena]KAJ5605389.1 hypothetical protein N7510_008170 [Penicillium lagena]